MALFQINSIDIYTNPTQPDQALIPFGQICFNSDTQKIERADAPVDPMDFTNKEYVDNAIATAISAILPLLKEQKNEV